MSKIALLIIDVQEAFNERLALGHKRNNPGAEANIARLLDGFRARGDAVYFIQHASTEPESLFRPHRSGYALQAFLDPQPDEPVIVKNVNSSFIGTSLESDLRAAGINRLVIVGSTSNHCVETTTRMAGNLGFDATLVRDAIWAFDQTGVDGEPLTAERVHQMTLANMNGEFAQIVTTKDIDKILSDEQI